MKILLGSKASVNAKNVDYQLRIDLQNSEMMYDEDTLYQIIDETVQFQTERNACTNYLIYGKVESFIDDALDFNSYSLGTDNYTVETGYISHYEPEAASLVAFTVVSANTITVASADPFVKSDVVLVYQDKNTFYYSKILDINGTTIVLDIDPTINIAGYSLVPAVATYKRHFNALYSSNYIKYYPNSFAINIFGSAIHQYHTYKNVNTSGVTNNLDQPITELVLKFTNKTDSLTYYTSGATITDSSIIDSVTYDLNLMEVTVNESVLCKFTKIVDFFYNPYMIIPIRKFSSTVTTGNESSMFDYPDYAILFYSGDIQYKNYLDVGYFEESTNGIDYPFMNNLNYLYNDTKFVVRRIVPLPSADTDATVISTDTTDFVDPTVPTGGARLC